jgi:hypothetical protein
MRITNGENIMNLIFIAVEILNFSFLTVRSLIFEAVRGTFAERLVEKQSQYIFNFAQPLIGERGK